MKTIVFIAFAISVLFGTVHAEEDKSRIKVIVDKGWNVCRALIAELESVKRVDKNIVCGDRLPISNRKFPDPEWQELDILDYLDVIYSLEIRLEKVRIKELPLFQIWRDDYVERMRSGAIKPSLRYTRARLSPDGEEEFILAYSRDRDSPRQCRIDIAQGKSVSGTGEHLFLFEPKARKAKDVYPETKSSNWSGSEWSPTRLIRYGDRTYLMNVGRLTGQESSVVLYPIRRFDPKPDRANIGPMYYADQVCNLQVSHPPAQSR